VMLLLLTRRRPARRAGPPMAGFDNNRIYHMVLLAKRAKTRNYANSGGRRAQSLPGL